MAPRQRVVTRGTRWLVEQCRLLLRRLGLSCWKGLLYQRREGSSQKNRLRRFFTLLGVSGSLMGSFLCFLKGTVCITFSFMEYFVYRAKVISNLIEAIDVYLIGTVMLVFGMGLYELFISNLDIAKTSTNRSSLFGLFMLQERPKWLEIKSVNELKTKLGHVIVMVLLVGLFEKSKKVVISSPADLLCFAASILLFLVDSFFFLSLRTRDHMGMLQSKLN